MRTRYPIRPTAIASAARHPFTYSYRQMPQAQYTSESSTIEQTGASLRDLREGKEFSRTQVAHRVGMSAQALANIEAGRQGLGPGEYERIADAIEKLAGRRGAANDADGGAKQEHQQPDDAGDAEGEGPFDWRSHLQPELAALLDGDPSDAVAAVGTKDAEKARRRLMELAKQQELREQDWRKAQVRAQAVRAARLIAARKLNAWDQEEAARRAGYANSTQLSLLESCSREVKLEHIEKFADVYRVSADFLLGRLSAETELDARRLASGRVIEGLHQVADLLMRNAEASDRPIGGPTVETVRNLVTHTRAVSSAMARIDGPALDAIKGGGTLAFAVEQLEEVAIEATRAITGYDGEVQRLRDLLRAPPANDPNGSESAEKNGQALSE